MRPEPIDAQGVDDERRHAADRFLGTLLEVPLAERPALLATLQAEDPPLYALVASLMLNVDALDEFLEHPIADVPEDRADDFVGRIFGHWRIVRPLAARRHGDRLRGRARRRDRAAARRAQADQADLRRRGHRRALPHRTPDPRGPRTSEHRAPDRRGRVTRGETVPRHGVRGRRAARSLVRRARTLDRRAHRALRRDLQRRSVRAPTPRRASRPQAEQHPRHGRGRAEAPRLRRVEAASPRSRAPADAQCRHRRRGRPSHAALREPRAAGRQADRDDLRRVFPRRGPVRVAHRPHALSPRKRVVPRGRARGRHDGAAQAFRGPARNRAPSPTARGPSSG